MNKIRTYIKNLFKTELFEEGSIYILLDNTDTSKYPDKYSEGVFGWYENGSMKISEEFQVNNGGDPIVFKKYLLKSSNINEVN
ncbi:hypothetical protein N9840_00915 [Gammaproteobacteria bacterium]|nr:hypothetical protein [Gammaproteobacteria bacterium]